MQASKTGQIAEALPDNELSDHEKIADFVQKKNLVTQKEIIEATLLSKGKVSESIKTLRDEGLVIQKREKRGRQTVYQWVGGTPAIEDELQSATIKQVSASLLAETYDLLVTDSFALFSIIFDGNGWEVIANLKEGLTDTELHQSLGNDVSLDSIRRILVICGAHDLIKLNRIRMPAGRNTVKLFDPLYRIDSINKDHLEWLKLIRGLASAIHYKARGQKVIGYSHIYNKMLDENIQSLIQIEDKVLSKAKGEESELMSKILSNYDYAADLDRFYKEVNWRQWLNQSKNLKLGDDDHILVSDVFLK